VRDQFALRYQALSILKQINEDLKGLLSQVEFLPSAPQAHTDRVDLNSCNPIDALTLVHYPEKTGTQRISVEFQDSLSTSAVRL
jgi:hypothetical protein